MFGSKYFLRAIALLAIAGSSAGCSKMLDAEGQLAGSEADVAKCAPAYSADSATPLPGNLPVPSGTHAYQYTVSGQTQMWYTTVPASSSQIVDVRNHIKQTLLTDGFVEMSEDQELGAEADFYFAGPFIGSVQVRPLCDGRIRVRYGVGTGSL